MICLCGVLATGARAYRCKTAALQCAIKDAGETPSGSEISAPSHFDSMARKTWTECQPEVCATFES